MKHVDKSFLPLDTRCPRCSGFLYDAVFNPGVKFLKGFRGMVYCLNCARFFKLEGNKLVQWPQRNGDQGYEVKLICSSEKKPEKKIKKRR